MTQFEKLFDQIASGDHTLTLEGHGDGYQQSIDCDQAVDEDMRATYAYYTIGNQDAGTLARAEAAEMTAFAQTW